ncbi:MAG: hypothetical protein CVU41_15950 [Chloroflexi bacterium HGW-Chloroflexi-3]|nr:MAG: hypothetical protein CVU41_15950 [Chloroflexi bacterium HGW-Chloroflexi-3]
MKLFSENQPLTRRDFLKRSSCGLLGLLAFPHLDHHFFSKTQAILADTTPSHGRVIPSTVDVFQSPSKTSKLVSTLWQDHVHPINSVTVGDEEPAYNRIWYEMGNEGFVHSGAIQPVCIRTNPEVEEISSSGRLGEVTVPFTNAVWHPKSLHLITYRLYYGTVFWVKSAVKDNNQKLWYKIADDKWKIHYYVEATHMHLFEPEEITPISPEIPIEQKKIEVRLLDQAVIAYEKGNPVFYAKTATGARFIDGDYRTQPGTYLTNRKRPSRHMAAGDPAAPNSYDLPGIPWVTYLTESGVSFHGTYWHNDFGKPRSHGCINLTPADAQWIYRWSSPSVPFGEETYLGKTGTRVDIF